MVFKIIKTKHQLNVKFIFLTLISGFVPSIVTAIEFFGVNSNSDALFAVDSQSGVARMIGPLHPDVNRYTTPVRMAVRQSDGGIYVINNSPDVDLGISKVDPITGLAQIVAPHDRNHHQLQALVFNKDDELLVQNRSGQVAKVNLDTGEYSIVNGVQYGIFFDNWIFNPVNGYTYGARSFTDIRFPDIRLYRIDDDLNIRQEIDIELPDYLGIAASFLFTPNGNLLVVSAKDSRRYLFEINIYNGQLITQPRTFNASYSPQAMGYHHQFIPITVPINTDLFLAVILFLTLGLGINKLKVQITSEK